MVRDMAKKNYILITCLFLFHICFANNTNERDKLDYVVITSDSILGDKDWSLVVNELVSFHDSKVISYKDSLHEVLDELRECCPRYVAFVEKPNNINRDYVICINQISRLVDDDIYTDFMWGVITGYDASSALKMVTNAYEPFVIRTCISTIKELEDGRWFDRFAYIDDHNIGRAGRKKSPNDKVEKYDIEDKIKIPEGCEKNFRRNWSTSPDLLGEFYKMYNEYNPDLIVTASHATEYNLEMPGSLGDIIPDNGNLYANFPSGKKKLMESSNRKVYLPIGNCQIGNIDNTIKSMAPAWMKSANLSAFVGYVVPTWHGRAGWGTLKYWITTPGRYSLSEALFLNMQDILYQLNEWDGSLITDDFNHNDWRGSFNKLESNFSMDQQGFFYDRDVLVYYGDPAANIRLNEIEDESDFNVSMELKDGKGIITIKTNSNFDLKRMKGNDFKKEHVLDLPFSYLFPIRLNNPRLSYPQDWNIALSKDFMLLYDVVFEPNMEYVIYLDVD